MANKRFLTDIDLNQNQLLSAAIERLSSAPGSPVQGQVYYSTTYNTFYGWTGSVWIDLARQGTVTSLTASTPLISSGGATPNLTIQQASGTQDGYLSSANWSTFNSKVGSINGLTGVTQTFAKNNNSIDFSISSSGTTHTFNLPFESTNYSLRLGYNTGIATNTTAMGISSGRYITGNNNTYYGSYSGMGISGTNTGINNTGIGVNCLSAITSGGSNTGVGSYSLAFNTTGSANAAFGYQSLQNNTTGANNAGFGYRTLFFNTTGNYNLGIGTRALDKNSSGSDNIGIGYYALLSNETGGANTCIGSQSFYNTIASDYNVGIGYRAGINNTGSGNTFLGTFSGYSSSTSSYSIFIGYNSGFNVTRSQSLIIDASSRSNSLIAGQIDNSRVGINKAVASIANTLHVGGGARIDNLAGVGSRMVTADANGDLSTAAIPSSGNTDLSYSSKSGSDVRLQSSTGDDVTIREDGGVYLDPSTSSILKIKASASSYGQVEETSFTTILSTSYTKVILGNFSSNGIDVVYSGPNTRIVISTAGTYRVSLTMNCSCSISTLISVVMYKNGSITSELVRAYFDNTNQYHTFTIDVIREFASADYIEIYAKGGAGLPKLLNSIARLNIQKIT